jgi:glycosyltransferase involved in cell wall biosynthesis
MITTIIPTLCEAARKEALLRAIRSIHEASSFPVRVLVVVNGQRFDPALVHLLKARDDLEVIQVAEGSQTNAQLVGRREVRSHYFSFLDDDDEYLPGALDTRRVMLERDELAAVAVTNGHAVRGGTDHVLYSRMSLVTQNPLAEIFHENWLHNCNHLFRSASVGIGYFEGAPSVLEWTWLGFRLATDKATVAASEAMTFRYNDTPGSLSKSANFFASRVNLYERMLRTGPPPDIVSIIRRRKSGAWHEVSAAELASGNRTKAIGAHLRSLTSHWSGLRYATFSRHLILPAW